MRSPTPGSRPEPRDSGPVRFAFRLSRQRRRSRAMFSKLNTQPACAPVNASRRTLQCAAHDSGSGRFATLFLCDSSIHYSTPVLTSAPGFHPAPQIGFISPSQSDSDRSLSILGFHSGHTRNPPRRFPRSGYSRPPGTDRPAGGGRNPPCAPLPSTSDRWPP